MNTNAELVCSGTTFVNQKLPRELKERIKKYGLRNGVALTVAPTGTISSTFFYIGGSGCEPNFAHEQNRNVRESKEGASLDSYRTYKGILPYAERLWRKVHGPDVDWPAFMVTAQELDVESHIMVQAAVQRWVDASVSKTVNCPEDISYDDFVKVYDLAYQLGCKGCTTYRPSDVRGSILSVSSETAGKEASPPTTKRPEALDGRTYQIKWPHRAAALYLTLNHWTDGRPAEMLISSKDSSAQEWMTALTLMITAIFKKGGDTSFVADELKQIQSYSERAHIDGKLHGSLPAYIGHLLEKHFNGGHTFTAEDPRDLKHPFLLGEVCPGCKQPTVFRSEGCKKCSNCTWSNCT
jgi:ribonucleoside-diphosphate reductase alpha chain